ncbi:hypothetical protein [Streptomyces sp. NPDC002573]|uniref:hypothetical protein n=1 Tax=Streptomyces sp. NPDC002573 TaxID=3364651 RepID=UPI0036A10902
MRRFTATISALALGAAGLIAASTGTAQASACSHAYLPLPGSSCTPGAYNPDVTQSNIHSTICVSGWSATVRPPTSYTNPLKAQGITDVGVLAVAAGNCGGCGRTCAMAPIRLWASVPEWQPGVSGADLDEVYCSGNGPATKRCVVRVFRRRATRCGEAVTPPGERA